MITVKIDNLGRPPESILNGVNNLYSIHYICKCILFDVLKVGRYKTQNGYFQIQTGLLFINIPFRVIN